MSIPKSQAVPQISIIFDIDGEIFDRGKQFANLEFTGMVNGGYLIKGSLYDPHFNLLNKLVSVGYFQTARRRPIVVKYQLRWGPKRNTSFPETATREQIAYLISMHAAGDGDDKGILEFAAIDPPSWLLNAGDGNGGVYKGRVSDVINKVIREYAPEVNADIGLTIDSPEGKWWMMRQDPKTFISSLFDWSSSITKQKTQWLFTPDGMNLVVKEQAAIGSKQRAFYRHFDSKSVDTVRSWELLADNALSVVQNKLITQGASVISGQYFDRITDKNEEILYVKDSRTPSKKIARIKKDQGFSKPSDSEQGKTGWTSISAIPEIYSAGDLGLPYGEYIDGRPRAMWLNMVNSLMRVKFECIGHGEWSSCIGLGTDTIFIKWISADGQSNNDRIWWMTGNWLVYGFNHRIDRKFWFTDVYAARFDYDSIAQKVG